MEALMFRAVFEEYMRVSHRLAPAPCLDYKGEGYSLAPYPEAEVIFGVRLDVQRVHPTAAAAFRIPKINPDDASRPFGQGGDLHIDAFFAGTRVVGCYAPDRLARTVSGMLPPAVGEYLFHRRTFRAWICNEIGRRLRGNAATSGNKKDQASQKNAPSHNNSSRGSYATPGTVWAPAAAPGPGRRRPPI